MAGQYHNMYDLLDIEDDAPRKPKKQNKPKATPAVQGNPNSGKAVDGAAPAAGGAEKKPRRKRGGKGRRAGAPRRGREFDKQSGTGRGKEVSKNGHGKGGWGREDEQGQPEDSLPPVVKPEQLPEAVEVEVEADFEAEVKEPERPKTPEPVMLSLEDHLAAKEAAKRDFDSHKHVEVVMDAKKWGNVVALHSDDEDDFEHVERKVKKKGKKGKKKASVLTLNDLSKIEIKPKEKGGRFTEHTRKNRRNKQSNAQKNINSDFPKLGQ